jgi:hypothetical protein
MPPSPAERALATVLRINGVITVFALPAVFMPLAWMDQTHQHLGMGQIPVHPIFEYLARTVSFMYFIHGGLCLLLARDVRRFGPVITYVALIEMVFACLVFWIDRKAAMPPAWTLTEAPLIFVISGTILVLRLRSRGLT